MPLLVDGNNLLYTLPQHQRDRGELRRLSLDLVRRGGGQVVVVFDGPPPPGAPEREELGRLTVLYAGSRPADEVIVSSLPAGATARNWVVVSDDSGLRARVRQRGGRVRSLARWRARLLAIPPSDGDGALSSSEIAEWEAYFAAREAAEE